VQGCGIGIWAEVEVVVGGGWVGGMVDRTEALASVPVGEGCQQHAGALQVLPFLYQCIVF
jgi:hypothetical protein